MMKMYNENGDLYYSQDPADMPTVIKTLAKFGIRVASAPPVADNCASGRGHAFDSMGRSGKLECMYCGIAPEPTPVQEGYVSPAVNPWVPMNNPIDAKHIGKLAEEAAELASAAARCYIQGIDEREPTTGKLNREWLEDEIADVYANVELCKSHFKLDRERIDVRKKRKIAFLQQWHNMLDGAPETLYQIKYYDDEEPVWRDATEKAYFCTPHNRRRILHISKDKS